MNISMLVFGSTGDVRPYTLLGKELQKKGHRITITAFPGFKKMIEDAGLCFHALSGSAEDVMKHIMDPSITVATYLTKVNESIRQIAPQLIEDFSDSCKDADAIICNFLGSVYYSIGEKYHIPVIQTQFFLVDANAEAPLAIFKSQHMGKIFNLATYRLGFFFISLYEKHLLDAWRKANHLTVPPVQSTPMYHLGGHHIPVLYAISPLLFPRPQEWDEKIHMTGFWYDDAPCTWQPPEDLQRFMQEGSTPIYIGFGSMNSGNMSRTLAIVLRAVRSSGVRAVISLGWSGEKLKSTKKVFFTEYISHDWLFPRVSAVVHHGGAGTTAAGLRHSKPTLVIPFGGDQPFWGERVHEMGCGPKPILRQNLTVQKLTKALVDLTTQAKYRVAATELGEHLRAERGTEKAAELIEQEIAAW